jgi:hypothetical protein
MLEQCRIGRDDAAVGDQEGVAIGRRSHQRADRSRGAAAGTVLHHHRLADPLLQMLADDARHRVRQPARCVGNDKADGLVRVWGFGVGLRREQDGQREDEGDAQRVAGHEFLDVQCVRIGRLCRRNSPTAPP